MTTPGWYPDQSDPQLQRYWNGDSWSRPVAVPDSSTLAVSSGALPARPRSRRRLHLSLAAVVIVIAIAAAAILVWHPWSRSSASSSFTARGTFDLNGVGSEDALSPDADFFIGATGVCFGMNGYDDIDSDTQVVVADAAGKTLAIGSLGLSKNDDHSSCEFTWTVDGVPAGQKYYKLSVGHRGDQQYTEAQLQEGVTLSLGA